MDWYAGIGTATEGLDIYYSEGGFQINLQVIPFGQWGADASNINILVAITNTGSIAVSYSYQGPEYQNLRTGVRLHDGSIVSLEAWGATQIETGEEIPTLEPEPLPEPSPSPTGPTQEELVAQEEARVVNNLLAAAAGVSEIEIITPEPEPTITPEPEPEPTNETEVIPDPDIVIEPEIITPEDPRYPEELEPNPNPSSDSTNNLEPSPTPEPLPSEDEALPSPEPSPEPTLDTNQTETKKPDQTPEPTPSKNNIINNDTTGSANLLADLSSTDSFIKMTEKEKEAASEALGVSMSDLATLAELVQDNPEIASALEEFDSRSQNATDVLPYTLADAVTEVQTEQFLNNPLGAILNVNPAELLSNFSELGMDMTDDQREKAQEVIVPVIIASNIVAAAMTRRK